MAVTYGTLRVVAGAGAGRTLKLQKLVTVIGSGRGSDLQVEGDRVAENHASIEAGADGTCVLRNRSGHGTLVNKVRVDVHRLADGDVIQVGAGALLSFHASGSRTPAAGPGQAKKILIGVGLGIYLAGMIALMVSLENSDEDAGGTVSEVHLEEALEATRASLRGKLDNASPRHSVFVDADDPTASYYRVLNAQADGAEQAVVDGAMDAFLAEMRAHLREAAALERQQRWKEARAQYRQVLERVPDVQLRVASLAAGRLAAIKGKGSDEKE